MGRSARLILANRKFASSIASAPSFYKHIAVSERQKKLIEEAAPQLAFEAMNKAIPTDTISRLRRSAKCDLITPNDAHTYLQALEGREDIMKNHLSKESQELLRYLLQSYAELSGKLLRDIDVFTEDLVHNLLSNKTLLASFDNCPVGPIYGSKSICSTIFSTAATNVIDCRTLILGNEYTGHPFVQVQCSNNGPRNSSMSWGNLAPHIENAHEPKEKIPNFFTLFFLEGTKGRYTSFYAVKEILDLLTPEQLVLVRKAIVQFKGGEFHKGDDNYRTGTILDYEDGELKRMCYRGDDRAVGVDELSQDVLGMLKEKITADQGYYLSCHRGLFVWANNGLMLHGAVNEDRLQSDLKISNTALEERLLYRGDHSQYSSMREFDRGYMVSNLIPERGSFVDCVRKDEGVVTR